MTRAGRIAAWTAGAALLAAAIAISLAVRSSPQQDHDDTAKPAEDHSAEEPAGVALVRTQPILRETIHPTIDALGAATVPPTAITVIAWPLEVAIIRILALPGQPIAAHDPIAQVSLTRDSQLQVDLARQAADSTAKALAAAQARIDRGLATRQELITAQAAADEARRRLDGLSVALPPQDGLIRSPSAGTILSVRAQPGAVVAANAGIVEIADPAAVVTQLGVEPSDAAALGTGQPVALSPLDDQDPARYEGTVTLVAPSVNPASRLIDVTAELTGQSRPRAGTALRARISLPAVEALTVPRSAVLPDDQDGWVIFIIRDGKAVRAPISPGRRAGDRVELSFPPAARGKPPSPAVATGDLVVVMGQSQLSDGAPVRQEGNGGAKGGGVERR